MVGVVGSIPIAPTNFLPHGSSYQE